MLPDILPRQQYTDMRDRVIAQLEERLEPEDATKAEVSGRQIFKEKRLSEVSVEQKQDMYNFFFNDEHTTEVEKVREKLHRVMTKDPSQALQNL